MATREILTLQLGHYSNFIGTHWWNLQESNFSYDPENQSEISHDVLYRQGENLQKEVTYTPRLLLVDLKGALGYLKKEGTLYDTGNSEETQDLLWDNKNIEIKKEEEIPKAPFVQSLESTEAVESKSFNLEDVNSWVDFLLPRFHPRTVNVIKEYNHNSTSLPFDTFTFGQNVWGTEQFSEDFTEKIRCYIEECDMLQGFQVILDSTDGFAGFGASCIQYLRDEYTRSILSFPCTDSKNAEPSVSDIVKALNTALCWQYMDEYSSLYSPLCCGESGWPQPGNPRRFDHLTYDQQLPYHTGALLATALDTLTIRYRFKEYPNLDLSYLCNEFSMVGRKAAATILSLPFPMKANMDLIDVLNEFEGNLWTNLTPSCNIPQEIARQSIVLRGIPEERLKRPIQDAMKQVSVPAYKYHSVHEMMSFYLSRPCYGWATSLWTTSSSLQIKDPYPKIFNNTVAETGDIYEWPVGADVKSVPVMAGLITGKSLSSMYESLHKQISRIRSIKKFHAFTDSGLEEDEFQECSHYLLDRKDVYLG